MTVRTLALLAATWFAANACGGGSGNSGYGSPTSPPTSPPVADQVNATAALAFDPGPLTTGVGHTVTFAFGSVGHNIFFDAATGGTRGHSGGQREYVGHASFHHRRHVHI